MNSKQQKTLAAIFEVPVSATIPWANIESLLIAVGCQISEGSGSRVKFAKNGVVIGFHRPHQAKEANRYQVRDVQAYLTKIGIAP
jgi:hypothetical protein